MPPVTLSAWIGTRFSTVVPKIYVEIGLEKETTLLVDRHAINPTKIPADVVIQHATSATNDISFENPVWPVYTIAQTPRQICDAFASLTEEKQQKALQISIIPGLQFFPECRLFGIAARKIKVTNKDGTKHFIKIPATMEKQDQWLGATNKFTRYKDQIVYTEHMFSGADIEGQVFHPALDVVGVDYAYCKTCGAVTINIHNATCRKCSKISPHIFRIGAHNERATALFPVPQDDKRSSLGIKPILMGVELELETGVSPDMLTANEIAKLAFIVGDHCIIKRDGSVSLGVEFCSRPAPIDAHEKAFSRIFEAFTTMPNIRATEACGMHVHINRASLSTFAIGKMTAFMNNASNKVFITTIARRESGYARFTPNMKIVTPYLNPYSYDRYSALNLTNKNTLEIRIFASTTYFNVFMQNLEFCQALVDYAALNMINAPLKEQLGVPMFLSFVQTYRKLYPRLSRFLADKGYIKIPPKHIPKESS